MAEDPAMSVRGNGSAHGLLERVRILYDLLEAARREPFNVFTAIRKSHDEVNLHSRFLHALLSHRDAEGGRPYLRKFLASVEATFAFQPDVEDAVVEREHQNIDLLITHRNPDWAVVIENKIWAGDQPGQLGRYYRYVSEYRQRVVLYLTPDGHEPEAQSRKYEQDGQMHKAPVVCISYRDNILPWLKECQQEAFDEPSLRESVAQYRAVVERLTGHSLGGAYMEKLTDLCYRNLPLVMDLMHAAVPAKKRVLRTIWKQVEEKAKTPLGGPGIRFGHTGSTYTGATLIPRDRDLEKWKCCWHCLLWPFAQNRKTKDERLHPEPALCVEIGNDVGLYYGIRCIDNNRRQIEEVLREFEVDGLPPTKNWSWRSRRAIPFAADTRGRLGERELWGQLAQLANDETALAKCVEEIVATLVRVRETLRKEMPRLFDDP